METSIKQRLMQFIKARKITINEFEKTAGLSKGYMRQLRHTPKNDKISDILSAYPELNKTWLLSGEGRMLNTPVYDIGISDNGVPLATNKAIPVFEDAKFGCSPAGFIGALEKQNADDHILVPGLTNDGQTFIVRARGESMINRNNPARSIPDGAYVAIQKSNLSSPLWGEVYALSTDDGCIIKRLYPSEHENHVRCVSLNKEEFPDFELHASEIHDIGIVKAVLTIQLWR